MKCLGAALNSKAMRGSLGYCTKFRSATQIAGHSCSGAILAAVLNLRDLKFNSIKFCHAV